MTTIDDLTTLLRGRPQCIVYAMKQINDDIEKKKASDPTFPDPTVSLGRDVLYKWSDINCSLRLGIEHNDEYNEDELWTRSTIGKRYTGSNGAPYGYIDEVYKEYTKHKRIREGVNDETPRMYLLINNPLHMTKGKIAGQCCHAACAVVRSIIEEWRDSQLQTMYEEWLNTGETKIILKANEELMREMIKRYSSKNTTAYKEKRIKCDYIEDLGRTQIPTGSLTVVGFYPMKQRDVPEEIKALSLL